MNVRQLRSIITMFAFLPFAYLYLCIRNITLFDSEVVYI